MKVVVDGIVLAGKGSVNGNMNADFPTCSWRLDVKTSFLQSCMPKPFAHIASTPAFLKINFPT